MTELTTSNGFSLNEIAAELGATSGSPSGTSASRMPELKIETQVDDDKGNTLPRGQFYIKGLEKVAYSDTITIRPIQHGFQYIKYDPELKKVACKSRIIPHFGEEARDSAGTLRCGKPISSVLRELPPEEKEKHNNTTCFRQVRALATFKGKTIDGEVIEYENQPVILMLKGTNFGPFDDEFLKKLPRGRNIWDYSLKLTSKRHKNGSVTWFTFHFDPDFKNLLGMDQDVVDSIGAVVQAIRTENARIDKAYKAALSNKALDQSAIDALENALEDDLEDVA